MGAADELERTLEVFREGVYAALGENLLAIYIGGSLTTGDFQPVSSDIDFLVVTRQVVCAAEMAALAALHARLPATWRQRFEGEYAALEQLRPWGIEGFAAGIRPGEELDPMVTDELTAENVKGIRESSVALFGPPAVELLPEVDHAALRNALVAYLVQLLDELPATVLRPERLPAADRLAATVLDIARCLYGLKTDGIATKSSAAAWLCDTLPGLEPALRAALAVRKGTVNDQAAATMAAAAPLLRHIAGEQIEQRQELTIRPAARPLRAHLPPE